MRLRMHFLDRIGGDVATNESEYIYLASLHDRTDSLLTRTIDDIDDAFGEALLERLQQRMNEQYTKLSRFEYNTVSHDKCGYQRGEGLVERIVIRAHAKYYPHRTAAYLCINTAFFA